MPEREYAAFISYRHSQVDARVARDIHRGLERFTIPKSLRESDGKAHIAPVFRDKEELALTSTLGDDIASALCHSDALIVICSPRTTQSPWVSQEIETYLSCHDRSRVFTVLAEGESSKVVPEVLLQEDAEGEVRRLVEPLSCDFRDARRSVRRVELMRLVAGILGLGFDDLAQRTHRRRVRAAFATLSLALLLAAGIASYALWSNMRIEAAYRKVMESNASLLATQASTSLASGDRLEAIELASMAVPDPGSGIPVQPQVTRVLSEAVGAYRVDSDFGILGMSGVLKAKYEVETDIVEMASSPDGTLCAARDSSGWIKAWETETGRVICRKRLDTGSDAGKRLVLTDTGLVVAAGWTQADCWDATTGEHLWTCEFPGYERKHLYSIWGIAFDDEGSAIAVCSKREVSLIDLGTGDRLHTVPYDMGGYIEDGIICDARGATILVGAAVHPKGESVNEIRIVSCNLDSEESTVMPVDEGYGIERVGMFEGNVCIAVYSDRLHGSGSSVGGQQSSVGGQQAYRRIVARLDPASGKVLWKHEVEAWQPTVGDELTVCQSVGEDGDEHEAVVYCFSNVCEVMDADSGERINHREVGDSYVTAWSEDSDTICGVLADGSYCSSWLNPKKGNTGQVEHLFVDSNKGLRIAGGVLLARGNNLLRYADKSYDEEVRLIGTWQSGYSISTSNGVVNIVSQGAGGDMTCELLDCVDGGIVWEQTLEALDDIGSWSYVGQDEETGSFFLRFVRSNGSGAEAEPDVLAVVSTVDGKVSSYDIEQNGRSWDGSSCFLASYAPITGRMAAQIQWLDDQVGFRLLLTDLLKGETRSLALGDESPSDRESGYWMEWLHQYANPTGTKVLAPIEKIDDPPRRDAFGVGSSCWRCVLIDIDTGQTTELACPLQFTDLAGKSFVVWSKDGLLLACIGSDSLLVFDDQGRVLIQRELDGSVPLSVHFLDGKLLVASVEGHHMVLSFYSTKDGKELGSTRLADEDSRGSDGSIPSYGAMGEPRWIQSHGLGPNPDRDPGNLCLLFPNERALYLIDTETMEVAQCVKGCEAYDSTSSSFVLRRWINEGIETVAFSRYSADDLLAKGKSALDESKEIS